MTTTPDLKAAALAATQGEWTCDCDIKNEGEYGSGEDCHSGFQSYGVYSGDKAICDTMNSDLIEVHEESDEENHYAWDETGRRNAEFIALANPATILALLERLQVAEDTAKVGVLMSNMLYNLAQKPGAELTQYDCDSMDELRKRFDAARGLTP